MVELNQIRDDSVDNEAGAARWNCREPEELPELQDDSGSDDDSEDDLSESSEENDELCLVRCAVRNPTQNRPLETPELKPQIRLNEAIHAAQRQDLSPSLNSIVENELSEAYDALESNSLSKSRAPSHSIVDSSSKIPLELQPSLPSSAAKNSGGKQRSTAQSPKSGRKDVCRKR